MNTENKIIVVVSTMIIISTLSLKIWLQSDKIDFLERKNATQESIIEFAEQSTAEKDKVIKCFLGARNSSTIQECHKLDFERNRSQYQKCIDSGEVNCSQWNNFNI